MLSTSLVLLTQVDKEYRDYASVRRTVTATGKDLVLAEAEDCHRRAFDNGIGKDSLKQMSLLMNLDSATPAVIRNCSQACVVGTSYDVFVFQGTWRLNSCLIHRLSRLMSRLLQTSPAVESPGPCCRSACRCSITIGKCGTL